PLASLVEVQHDLATFPGERPCTGPTDPAGSPCHQHPLARKTGVHGGRLRLRLSSLRAERPKEGLMMPSAEFNDLEVGLAVLEALDQNEELTKEELDVRAWRFGQLIEHGYEIEDAMIVARADYVDLELARALVRAHGCASRLAVRILL